MRKIISLALSALALFVLISCSTTVSSTVTRPAELDMHGATTIAVLPFQEFPPTGSSGSSADTKTREDCCDYISDELEDRLADVEYYTLESSARLKAAIEKGRPSPAEVYITGYINYFRDNVSVDERKTIVDEEEVIERSYTRDVRLEVVYQIVDTTSNIVLHKDSKTITDGDRADNRKDLLSAYDLVKSELSDFVNEILKKIQPYEERVYFTLLDSKSKDEDMKLAQKLAKNGQISAAAEKYLSYYDYTGDFVAGYNGAILLEANGDLYRAKEIMQELADATADKRAVRALNNINREIELSEKLEKQNANRIYQ